MSRNFDPRNQKRGWMPGDHACAPYLGARHRDDIIVPFLEEGLREHDACVCVVDAADPDVRIEKALASVNGGGRYLDVWTATEMYCPDGEFRIGETVDRWRRTFDAAVGSPGPRSGHIRVAADVSPTTTCDTLHERYLLSYELAYNHTFADYSLIVLCLYDLERFDRGTLRKIYETHPQVLLDEVLLDNPGYIGREGVC